MFHRLTKLSVTGELDRRQRHTNLPFAKDLSTVGLPIEYFKSEVQGFRIGGRIIWLNAANRFRMGAIFRLRRGDDSVSVLERWFHPDSGTGLGVCWRSHFLSPPNLCHTFWQDLRLNQCQDSEPGVAFKMTYYAPPVYTAALSFSYLQTAAKNCSLDLNIDSSLYFTVQYIFYLTCDRLFFWCISNPQP